jgi:hypothetical protein
MNRPMICAALCVAALSSLPGSALAQPSPFDAYEQQKTPDGAAVTPSPSPAASTDVPDPELFAQSRFAFGALGSFSGLSAQDTRSDGRSLESSTVVGRISALVAYRLLDDVELQFLPGVMVRSVSVQDSSSASVSSGVFELRGVYRLPLTPRLRLLPALGAGMHFGSGSLDVPVERDGKSLIVTEKTSSWGGIFTGEIALGYAVQDIMELRLGLTGGIVVGRESSELTDLDTTSTTMLTGLQVGVVFWF